MIYPDLAPKKNTCRSAGRHRTPPDLDEIATAHQLIHGTLVMANPGKKKHREFISMFGKSAIVVRVVNPNDIQHSFQRKSWDL